MKNLPPGLIALLLAGAVAVCLASQSLYGQGVYGQQGTLPYRPGMAGRPDAVQVWREAAAMGLSYNEALALSRLRTNSTVPTPLHPRFQAGAGAGLYQPTYSGHQGVSVTPTYSTNAYRQPISKPFAGMRPAPTAFERYWPLLLEGREDPETGVVIWSIP
ncbi:MAG: hypothetical protein SH868_06725 [Bythopirellula sp.]|nr:hypothetical protein [Bythopirellula sp.]